MRLGKLSNEQLERLVLQKYTSTRPEAFGAPRVGEDCAVLDIGGDLAVLSTDPITSAAAHIGRLSVHINCNDAAAAGAEPVGLMVTLLAPPDACEEEIAAIAEEMAATAKEVGVDILGGHTEVTDSVTRYVTSTTVIARLKRSTRLCGMRAGDDIVLTKWAGLEGGMVLAADFRERLTEFSAAEFAEIEAWGAQLSVVPEGVYAAAHGASAMHDVTEGGVYGAAWEMSYAAGVGIALDEECIPVHKLVKKLSAQLRLDPMRLLSSGCMLIACANGEEMCKGLREQNIPAACIGVAGGEGVRLQDGTALLPPEADELYRLFS